MHARSAREINQCYRTLRPRLLMCMIIGYAAFYLTRKSVNYVLPACNQVNHLIPTRVLVKGGEITCKMLK